MRWGSHDEASRSSISVTRCVFAASSSQSTRSMRWSLYSAISCHAREHPRISGWEGIKAVSTETCEGVQSPGGKRGEGRKEGKEERKGHDILAATLQVCCWHFHLLLHPARLLWLPYSPATYHVTRNEKKGKRCPRQHGVTCSAFQHSHAPTPLTHTHTHTHTHTPQCTVVPTSTRHIRQIAASWPCRFSLTACIQEGVCVRACG